MFLFPGISLHVLYLTWFTLNSAVKNTKKPETQNRWIGGRYSVLVSLIYVLLAASPRRACGGRRIFGFAERFAAPQRPSAVGVLVLVPRGGSASLRRAITQALRAWLRALRAQTKSSPTASIERSAFGRIKTRPRRAIWQALRARRKSSPTLVMSQRS